MFQFSAHRKTQNQKKKSSEVLEMFRADQKTSRKIFQVVGQYNTLSWKILLEKPTKGNSEI